MGLLTSALNALFPQSSNSDSALNTTNCRIPFFKGSGQNWDLGSTSMANLASVLGVLKYKSFITNSNLPEGTFASMRGANMNGFYGFSQTNLTPSDAPEGISDGAIFHLDFYNDISLQVCFNRLGGMKSRFYWYGAWTSWQ